MNKLCDCVMLSIVPIITSIIFVYMQYPILYIWLFSFLSYLFIILLYSCILSKKGEIILFENDCSN